MALPPTIEIDVLASSLCRLDDELSALDLDYSLRSQYLFTARKFLGESEPGRILQQLVDLAPCNTEQGEVARTVLNRLIASMPAIDAEDSSKHFHGSNNLIHTSPDAFGPPCTCQLPSSLSSSSFG